MGILFQRVLSTHGSNSGLICSHNIRHPVISDPTCSSAALGTFHHYLQLMAYISDLLYLYRLTHLRHLGSHAKGRSRTYTIKINTNDLITGIKYSIVLGDFTVATRHQPFYSGAKHSCK